MSSAGTAPAEPLSLEHDPILFVSHSVDPLDGLLEPAPPESLPEGLLDVDEDVELDTSESVEQEQTMSCKRPCAATWDSSAE